MEPFCQYLVILMTTPTALALLQRVGLRKTDVRLATLEVFLNTPVAIGFEDLEPLQLRFDRATLYRTLNSLLEHRLIHRIQDPLRGTLYGLSWPQPEAEEPQEPASPDADAHAHAHFSCESCSQTFCLTEMPIPALHLPAGYKARHLELHLRGTCGGCSRGKGEA